MRPCALPLLIQHYHLNSSTLLYILGFTSTGIRELPVCLPCHRVKVAILGLVPEEFWFHLAIVKWKIHLYQRGSMVAKSFFFLTTNDIFMTLKVIAGHSQLLLLARISRSKLCRKMSYWVWMRLYKKKEEYSNHLDRIHFPFPPSHKTITVILLYVC